MTDPFALIAATWPPAETARLGPWTLRRGAGGGSRLSAATLDGPFSDLADAAAAMRGWGQRPLAMIRPGEADLDDRLATEGWTRDKASLILAAPAAALAGDALPGERAIDCDGPLACMTAIWDAGGVGPGRRAAMARAAGPRAWLLGRTDAAPVACAFVALGAGGAMLHALQVAPEARRTGQALRIMQAAAGWARARGAEDLAVAVTEENGAALALYRRLGMVEVARYHYRLAPKTPLSA